MIRNKKRDNMFLDRKSLTVRAARVFHLEKMDVIARKKKNMTIFEGICVDVQVMDARLFKDILEIDSTTGGERRIAEFLAERLTGPVEGFPEAPACTLQRQEVGDGTLNLLLDWSGTGHPSFVFCTHMDTVPPYIAPAFLSVKAGDLLPDGRTAGTDDTLVTGRGSCDAKGQAFAMYTACRELERLGRRDFGLLLLSGEETGSFGAKAWTRDGRGGAFVLVGEPTDNCLVTASKGTKAFQVRITGTPCHSGYPAFGESAVDKFVDFVDGLRCVEFPSDPLLGETTWNIGVLRSDNPQNILSPEISFRLYFRTTFASDGCILPALEGIAPAGTEVEALGGDTPLRYWHDVGSIPAKSVAFGSDAPRLDGFAHRAICGPGSILTAHTEREYVLLSDLQKAVEQYVTIFEAVNNNDKTNLV